MYLWWEGGAGGSNPPTKKKNLKTSNFKHINNIIILFCIFNKVLKYNEYIYKKNINNANN
jgi:hypothetical protein